MKTFMPEHVLAATAIGPLKTEVPAYPFLKILPWS